TRAFDEVRYRRTLLQGLGGLDKCHVRARTQSCIGTPDRLIEPQDSPRVRARDDDELRILPGCDGGSDFRQIFFQRHDHFVVQMPALLREALVLDVQAGDPAPLVFAHGASSVELIAVTGIGIRDHRYVDSRCQPAGVVRHLGHGDEAVVGISERGRGTGASHIDRIKTGLSDSPGRDAVIGPRCHEHAVAAQQLTKLSGCIHVRLLRRSLQHDRRGSGFFAKRLRSAGSHCAAAISMLRCKGGGAKATMPHESSPARSRLSPVQTLALENGALVLAGRANELTDYLSLKRSCLVGAHCWAFQAARMSAPVADHTPPWLWMRSST